MSKHDGYERFLLYPAEGRLGRTTIQQMARSAQTSDRLTNVRKGHPYQLNPLAPDVEFSAKSSRSHQRASLDDNTFHNILMMIPCPSKVKFLAAT